MIINIEFYSQTSTGTIGQFSIEEPPSDIGQWQSRLFFVALPSMSSSLA
jgi:hypothetical protein